MELSVVSFTTLPLYPRETAPAPIGQEAECGLRAYMGATEYRNILALLGIENRLSSPLPVAMLTELSRLS
jgi:hypothetical protein